MASKQPDWSVFDTFRCPRGEEQTASWPAAVAWQKAVDAQFAPMRERVAALRACWDEELQEFGGDPHSRDWARFRALRRHREEDWSDWLAQLIEDSETGWFAWRVLGASEGRTSAADYVAVEVQREVSRDGFRADLVVLWSDATYTHIEVKVGDEALEKTRETGLKMEELFRGIAERRSDILLLLPEQRPAWEALQKRQSLPTTYIRVLDWVDIAVSLRDALRTARREPPLWRAFAYALCGAVEQDLLGVQSRPGAGHWVRGLPPMALERAETLLRFEGEA